LGGRRRAAFSQWHAHASEGYCQCKVFWAEEAVNMSWWSWIRAKLTGESGTAGGQVAESRDTGGVDQPSAPDRHSTTGTTPNDTFVGRVAGSDIGYEQTTGAEARAAAEDPDDER